MRADHRKSNDLSPHQNPQNDHRGTNRHEKKVAPQPNSERPKALLAVYIPGVCHFLMPLVAS
jgi:hypothetical protein